MLSATKLKRTNKNMNNTTTQTGFTAIIEMENSHNQIILNDVTLRKSHGSTSLAFEISINNKFLVIRGRLIKGENEKTFHIESNENKHIIKEILS